MSYERSVRDEFRRKLATQPTGPISTIEFLRELEGLHQMARTIAFHKQVDEVLFGDLNTIPVAEPHRDPGDEHQERRA